MRCLDPDVALARDWARFYRSKGYNPLPSRRDRKVPALRSYTRERDNGIPDSLLEHWHASNIQLACGARWGLAVVDLDGDRSLDTFLRLGGSGGHRPPHTWAVRTANPDGSCRGLHLWFDPEGEPVATRIIHGDWDEAARRFQKRSLIELKGEKALIVAPPSIHPETGQGPRPAGCPPTPSGPGALTTPPGCPQEGRAALQGPR
jgi:hypothetical protein